MCGSLAATARTINTRGKVQRTFGKKADFTRVGEKIEDGQNYRTKNNCEPFNFMKHFLIITHECQTAQSQHKNKIKKRN
mgnify:CR=1 FL=1